jgi:hypothetical protein
MHLALGGLPGVFGSPRRPCSSRGWAGPSGASPPCEGVQKFLVGGLGERGLEIARVNAALRGCGPGLLDEVLGAQLQRASQSALNAVLNCDKTLNRNATVT